jgi:hypothetical protein
MGIFTFRDRLVAEYQRFTRSFVTIRAADIKAHVDREYEAERFWAAPMVQLNPAFVPGGDIGEFVAEGLLHPECERIFRFGKTDNGAPGKALTLHRHQERLSGSPGTERASCSQLARARASRWRTSSLS